MAEIIFAFLVYEIFARFLSNYFQNANTTRNIDLSLMEMRLFKDNTLLSLFCTIFIAVARINGIAFLIYFAYIKIWYLPILIWIAAVIISSVISVIFKHKYYGIAPLALSSFIVVPIAGIIMWMPT